MKIVNPYTVLLYRKTETSEWKVKFGDDKLGPTEQYIALEKYANTIKDKVYEVRIMDARMLIRWGPIDTGGARIVSQSRYDNGVLRNAAGTGSP